MPARLRLLNSRTVYSGRVLELKVDRVIEPGRITADREVVLHRGSVVVVPHLPDGRLVLVRQYRYAVRRSLWEFVAGGLEPRESPRAAAHRELLEEAGYRARRVKLLCDFYSTPGITSERMFLLEASGLTQSKASPDPDERIQVGHFSLSQLAKMVRGNEIHDAKTLVGVLWLLCPRKKPR